MNVYINKRKPCCGHGMILVAANSKQEAHKIMLNNDDGEYYHMFYDHEDWIQLDMLVANVKEPQVIAEEGHHNSYID